jgi:hypothetical protein
MQESYRKIGKQAENAVRGIRDKDLRREAFRILLLQFMAAGTVNGGGKISRKERKKATTSVVAKRKIKIEPLKRQGRRAGGIGTVAVQKLIDSGAFKAGRDAAGVMRELWRHRIRLEPSQLRMSLLRFSRSGKLKRRVKMKGQKVTYLYSAK